eukprot:TRINITY_DN24635_c0_g1_i1.p1 TRINITY_DN24635_c0_g1~~TRINITY_DN24635_c0_g1_i1.p1  ORF type:complete len:877 (+),score=186.42 TRINITY_DN24635_c0_g1_i1:272-2902(+)
MPRARRGEPSTQAQQSAWRTCVRIHEGRNEVSIGMSGWGMTDQDIVSWCDWFVSHLRKTRGKNSERLLAKEINFSKNQLTALGVRSLLETLHDLDISPVVLQIHHNRLSTGGDIARFLAVNGGALRELHLSHNDLDTEAVMDIIFAAAAAKDEHGEFLYPHQNGARNAAPLWMRLEQNFVDCDLLKERVEEASRQLQRPGRVLCSVTDKGCTPHSCNRHRLDPPAIHAKSVSNQRRRHSSYAGGMCTPGLSSDTSLRSPVSNLLAAGDSPAAAAGSAAGLRNQDAPASPTAARGEDGIRARRTDSGSGSGTGPGTPGGGPVRLLGRTRGRYGVRGEPMVLPEGGAIAGGFGFGFGIGPGNAGGASSGATAASASGASSGGGASGRNAASRKSATETISDDAEVESEQIEEKEDDDDGPENISVDVLRWDDESAAWVKDSLEVPRRPPAYLAEYEKISPEPAPERRTPLPLVNLPPAVSHGRYLPQTNGNMAHRGGSPNIFALLGQAAAHPGTPASAASIRAQAEAEALSMGKAGPRMAGTLAAAKSGRRRTQPTGSDVKQGKGSALNASAREFVPGFFQQVPKNSNNLDDMNASAVEFIPNMLPPGRGDGEPRYVDPAVILGRGSGLPVPVSHGGTPVAGGNGRNGHGAEHTSMLPLGRNGARAMHGGAAAVASPAVTVEDDEEDEEDPVAEASASDAVASSGAADVDAPAPDVQAEVDEEDKVSLENGAPPAAVADAAESLSAEGDGDGAGSGGQGDLGGDLCCPEAEGSEGAGCAVASDAPCAALPVAGGANGEAAGVTGLRALLRGLLRFKAPRRAGHPDELENGEDGPDGAGDRSWSLRRWGPLPVIFVSAFAMLGRAAVAAKRRSVQMLGM